MRVFELSTHLKAVQRSRGDSATARAAYRACCVVECERENRVHDYSRKRGLEAAEIVLPHDAPAWARDRARLWNAAELRERNGKRGPNANAFRANAQTARDLMFSFADELTAEGRRNVARAVARHLVDAHGVAVDFAIHAPGGNGDQRNWHCHLMFTTRRMTAKGLGEKTREWDTRKEDGDEPGLAKALRAFIARLQNDELAAEGKGALVHVEHRTFKARGSAQTPTRHQGPAKTHTQRKQQQRERERWLAEQEAAQREHQSRERAALQARHDFAMEEKRAELGRRARDGAAAIRAELDAQRRADTGPTGLRRAFLIVTGRAMREAFERQARDAERVRDARAKLAGLKAELKAEGRAFSEAQARQRDEMVEHHAAQARQFGQSASHRHGLDLAAERAARRAENQNERQRSRAQERGKGFSLGL